MSSLNISIQYCSTEGLANALVPVWKERNITFTDHICTENLTEFKKQTKKLSELNSCI